HIHFIPPSVKEMKEWVSQYITISDDFDVLVDYTESCPLAILEAFEGNAATLGLELLQALHAIAEKQQDRLVITQKFSKENGEGIVKWLIVWMKKILEIHMKVKNPSLKAGYENVLLAICKIKNSAAILNYLDFLYDVQKKYQDKINLNPQL